MQKLKAVVTDGDMVFFEGDFEVSPENYSAVVPLLAQIDMTPDQADDILRGYMHAKDVGPVSEEMGKIALIATVYYLERGETEVRIPHKPNETKN